MTSGEEGIGKSPGLAAHSIERTLKRGYGGKGRHITSFPKADKDYEQIVMSSSLYKYLERIAETDHAVVLLQPGFVQRRTEAVLAVRRLTRLVKRRDALKRRLLAQPRNDRKYVPLG